MFMMWLTRKRNASGSAETERVCRKGHQAHWKRKLSNENFTSRAKPEVVEQSRQKLKELQEQLAAIEKHLAELE